MEACISTIIILLVYRWLSNRSRNSPSARRSPYYASIRSMVAESCSAMERFHALLNLVGADSTIQNTAEWQKQMHAQAAEITRMPQRVALMHPPPDCMTAHSHMSGMAMHYARWASMYADAFDREDQALADSAPDEKSLGDAAAERTSAELQRLNDSN